MWSWVIVTWHTFYQPGPKFIQLDQNHVNPTSLTEFQHLNMCFQSFFFFATVALVPKWSWVTKTRHTFYHIFTTMDRFPMFVCPSNLFKLLLHGCTQG